MLNPEIFLKPTQNVSPIKKTIVLLPAILKLKEKIKCQNPCIPVILTDLANGESIIMV